MSLYFSDKSAENLKGLFNKTGLTSSGLKELLSKIDANGLESIENISKVKSVRSDIYIVRHNTLRLFFTKRNGDTVLMDVIEHNANNPLKNDAISGGAF
jgi:hypothetical protein